MTREEAIKRIKEWNLDSDDMEVLFVAIPELTAETDDENERIRKDIIALIKFGLTEGSAVSPGSHTTKEEAIVYLEKLGEQKYLYYDQGFVAGMQQSKLIANSEIIVSPLKMTNKVSVSEELYEHIRETCACIDDAMSSDSLVDITDYLEMADKSAQAAFDMLEKQKEQPTNEEMLITLRTEYEKGVADTIAKYEQKEREDEHFELKAGKWYICHHAFCCRADHLTVKEGERFMCEKDGVVKGFIIKEPEKYFIECSAPAPMEDEQKKQKPELPSNLDEAAETFNNEDAARMWDYEGKTQGEIVEAAFKAGAEWQKEQKPTEWTELTWKDIVELEGIINNVHYDFSAGIGQESFGKEVLERFRNKKDDAEVDACEQKPYRKRTSILMTETTTN